MNILPNELLGLSLSFLPSTELCSLQRVCKKWFLIIRSLKAPFPMQEAMTKAFDKFKETINQYNFVDYSLNLNFQFYANCSLLIKVELCKEKEKPTIDFKYIYKTLITYAERPADLSFKANEEVDNNVKLDVQGILTNIYECSSAKTNISIIYNERLQTIFEQNQKLR